MRNFGLSAAELLKPAVEFTAEPDEDSAGAILFAGVAHDLISFGP
jgi:hypothetical protein